MPLYGCIVSAIVTYIIANSIICATIIINTDYGFVSCLAEKIVIIALIDARYTTKA